MKNFFVRRNDVMQKNKMPVCLKISVMHISSFSTVNMFYFYNQENAYRFQRK